MGILLVYDVTDERSFNSASSPYSVASPSLTYGALDIRTWHANIEQHASEGVNKILIGNKSDWSDKRAVTEEQGRELADELGIKFMETSAKVNDGVEEAFFTLARYAKAAVRVTASALPPCVKSGLTLLQGHQGTAHRLTTGSNGRHERCCWHGRFGEG